MPLLSAAARVSLTPMHKLIGISTATALCALTAPAAQAGELIVSREGNAIALYIRIPLQDVEHLFGHRPEGLVDASGQPQLDSIFEGTFDGADALLGDVGFTLGGAPVTFEALSMMAHIAETPLPFDTPLDAQVAIAVCGVPTPEGTLQAEDMVWIGGWYAYPVDPDQDITVTFPATSRAPLDLTIKSFDDWRAISTSEVTVSDGGTLTLETEPRTWAARLFGG